MRTNAPTKLIGPALVLAVSTLILITTPLASAQPSWTETSSSDFNDGTLENTEVVSDDLRLSDVSADSWTQATSSAPWTARDGHTSVVYDGKMWVIGGSGGGANRNDVWYSSDGTSWTQATDSAGWSGRYGLASAVYDGKMWVAGGDTGTYRNDVWYSTDGTSWTQATDSAGWSERHGHTLFTHDGEMWVIGGWSGSNENDVWYSSNGASWNQATSAALWSGRRNQTSVVYDGNMWVIGGDKSTGMVSEFENDVWYSTDGTSWTQATSDAAWTGRRRHTSVVYDGKMWVIGGYDGDSRRNDVWYSTDGDNWTQATASANWSIRSGHTSVVHDGKMWVIGGYGGGERNDVWWWAPYRESGTYVSSDHDTGNSNVEISQVSWNASGSALSMEVAAGNSSNPTNWESVSNGDTSVGVEGQFIRYRATFDGTGLSDDPELEDVTIEYGCPTSLTSNVDNSNPTVGQEIVFSGYLKDSDGSGVSGKTVYLYKNGGDTGLTTTTEPDGHYGILTNASSTTGTDNYSVRFVGEGLYLFSESSEVQVSVGEANQPPSLSNGSVAPGSGSVGDNFVFEVTYSDPDGDAPSSIEVFIDDTSHGMTKTSGDYTTGATYKYTWTPSSTDVGDHNHHFEASDDEATARLPSTDNYSGPTVSQTYKISGYVESDGSTVSGAQVTLDGQSTTSDENGYYEFTGLDGGTSYDITVSAEGYENSSEPISIGTADVKSDVSLTEKAKGGGLGVIPIAVIIIVVVGCLVGGVLIYKKGLWG